MISRLLMLCALVVSWQAPALGLFKKATLPQHFLKDRVIVVYDSAEDTKEKKILKGDTAKVVHKLLKEAGFSPRGGHPMNLERWRSAAKDAMWALDFFCVRTAKGVWLSALLVIDLHTREIMELRACDAWGPTSEWTIRTFASAIHREDRQPEAVVHDHGTHFLGQFERQLRVLEIERRRTPVALPFVNGVAERAIKSARLDLLNHVRVRDVEELQWYLDEYRAYYNQHRANQALGGQTPVAFGRDSPSAEVISLDEVRRRKLVRRSFANGLLNAYELADDESAAA